MTRHDCLIQLRLIAALGDDHHQFAHGQARLAMMLIARAGADMLAQDLKVPIIGSQDDLAAAIHGRLLERGFEDADARAQGLDIAKEVWGA